MSAKNKYTDSINLNRLLSDEVIQSYLSQFHVTEHEEILQEVIRKGIIVTNTEQFAYFLDEAEATFNQYYPKIFAMYQQEKGRQEERDNSTHGHFDLKGQVFDFLSQELSGLGECVNDKGEVREGVRTGNIIFKFVEQEKPAVVTLNYRSNLRKKDVEDQLAKSLLEDGLKYGVFVYDVNKPIKGIKDRELLYLPEKGFVAQIDKQKNNFETLKIALELVNDLNEYNEKEPLDKEIMQAFCQKCIANLKTLKAIKTSQRNLLKESQKLGEHVEHLETSFKGLRQAVKDYISMKIDNKEFQRRMNM